MTAYGLDENPVVRVKTLLFALGNGLGPLPSCRSYLLEVSRGLIMAIVGESGFGKPFTSLAITQIVASVRLQGLLLLPSFQRHLVAMSQINMETIRI